MDALFHFVINVFFYHLVYNKIVSINLKEEFIMFEQLKKLAMIGIGGTAIAVEKLSDYVDELVDQGKITVEEGKKLTEELIQSKKKDTSEEDREEIEAILLDMNLAQRKDIVDLENRIAELERELDQTKSE
jgi:polyhydroxyalkanoate synthesis regulator phasin